MAALPAIARALAVDTSLPTGGGCAFLFVVLRLGYACDDALRAEIYRRCVAASGTVPDAVYAAADLPRAADGRLLPAALRRLLTGEPAARVAVGEGVANPAALEFFAFLFNNL